MTPRTEIPLDQVQITLRPAARIADEVTGQILDERKYWFIIANIEGTEEHVSARTHPRRDAVHFAERFHG